MNTISLDPKPSTATTQRTRIRAATIMPNAGRAIPCFHGGAFFEAVGPEFDQLERHQHIINADVLDAWFPPSPRVIAALSEHLAWLARTSPPAACEGLLRVLSEVRGVPPECLVPGGGSSDLIFRALPLWVNAQSKVLLLDPTYGEYAHVLEKVLRCQVARFPLRREHNYAVEPDQLARTLRGGFDLVVIVNPNSPTGQHLRREQLEPLLHAAPAGTRFWIDETYMEYVGAEESLEKVAACHDRVVVCKSMSKVYALSGLRAAYLCASPSVAAEVRSHTPPWAIGLPAQVAAVNALKDTSYYQARYSEIHALRLELQEELQQLGLDVIPGIANFLLCHLPESGPQAASLVALCRQRGLFLRDAAVMGANLGHHAMRIAVKDRDTNQRMVAILRDVLRDQPASTYAIPNQTVLR